MIDTNNKILFFGILLVSVLFLSSCQDGAVGVRARIGSDPNSNNACVQCIGQGNEYCTQK